MFNVVVLAIVYAILGLAFGISMFVIAGRIKSFTTQSGTALMIDLGRLGKYETGNAFVGLAMLSVVVMIVVPIYCLYRYYNVIENDSPITLTVPFYPPRSEPVTITSNDENFPAQETPKITLYKTHYPQTYSIQGSQSKASIPIQVWFDAGNNQAMAIIRNSKPEAVANYALPSQHFDRADTPAIPSGPPELTKIAVQTSATVMTIPDPAQITADRLISGALPLSSKP